MGRKRSSAVKKEPEEVEVDLEEVFGFEEPGPEEPEEKEEPDGVQEREEEAAPEAEEVVEEPVAAEEPETVVESEATPAPEEVGGGKIEELEKARDALLQEVMRMKAKMREKDQASVQAPMPLQQPQQQQQPALPPVAEPSFNFEFEVADDGTMKPTKESMQGFAAYNQSMVDERVAAATQVDPRIEMERIVESETQKWVNADPHNAPQRFQASRRIKEASENMEVMINHHTVTTGQNPAGVTEWLQTMEYSGAGQTFRQAYPEITDLYSFVETFFAPTSLPHRIEKVRRYMDVHMLSQSSGGESAERMAAGLPGAQAAPPSNVVPLSTDRPRSMAEKGRGMEAGTTEQKEFDALMDEVGDEPIGMSEGSQEKFERLKYLARKLKIDM